jgi:hypothetical protein
MHPQKYTREELEDFVSAISAASESIHEYDPFFYLVSLNGGLPLFDILQIVSTREIDPAQAIYFPGSSKIRNSKEVLKNCFINFFLENQHAQLGQRKIASLDEVVGGHSVCRTLNAYDRALHEVAKYNIQTSDRSKLEQEVKRLRQEFPLKIFAIKDTSKSRKMSKEYLLRKKQGQILEFSTRRIITMDDPDYQTVEFQHPNTSGWSGMGYLPRIEALVISRPYMDLLHDIAMLVGKDPEDIDVSRARVRTHCEHYSKKPELK